jgi:putative ABC transport system ATP-binding protein
MITGIDRPTMGQVLIGGIEVNKLSEGQMSIWRGRNIGIVFQFFQLLPTLTLLQNIMLPMDFCNLYTPRQRKERALELLRLVEMEAHANKLPSAVSGGQQQRVAIARALANDPPIIIADEPTGNLDSRTAEAMFDMFERLVKQGKTVVVVTHDSSLSRRFSRTLLISDGEVVNSWVFKALPTLTYHQMLVASKSLQTLSFSSGQTIVHENQPGENFYIVTQGTVEIVVRRPNGGEMVVSRMGPGQYFGEIELLKDSAYVASARANGGPVELVTLSHQVFHELMAESEATQESVENMARERLMENKDARRVLA